MPNQPSTTNSIMITSRTIMTVAIGSGILNAAIKARAAQNTTPIIISPISNPIRVILCPPLNHSQYGYRLYDDDNELYHQVASDNQPTLSQS